MYFSYTFKGCIQQDVTGVESRLKKSVLISYNTRKIYFQNVKDRYHERSIEPVSGS